MDYSGYLVKAPFESFFPFLTPQERYSIKPEQLQPCIIKKHDKPAGDDCWISDAEYRMKDRENPNTFHVVVILIEWRDPKVNASFVAVTSTYIVDEKWWQIPDSVHVKSVFVGNESLDTPKSTAIAVYDGFWPEGSNGGVTIWNDGDTMPTLCSPVAWIPLPSFIYCVG